MPQQPIADTTRVSVLQSIGNEIAVNIWHVLDLVPGTPVVANTLRTAFINFYKNIASATPKGINGLHHDTWRLDQVCTQRLDSVPWPDPTCTASGVVGQENVVPALPDQTSYVLSLRTGGNGRRGRGRIYLAGLHENLVSEDSAGNARPSTSMRTQLSDALAALDDGVNAAGGQVGVLSEVDGVCRPVTSVILANKFATQRRRQAGIPVTTTTTVSFLEA